MVRQGPSPVNLYLAASELWAPDRLKVETGSVGAMAQASDLLPSYSCNCAFCYQACCTDLKYADLEIVIVMIECMYHTLASHSVLCSGAVTRRTLADDRTGERGPWHRSAGVRAHGTGRVHHSVRLKSDISKTIFNLCVAKVSTNN